MFKILKNAINTITEHNGIFLEMRLKHYDISVNFYKNYYYVRFFKFDNKQKILHYLLSKDIENIIIRGEFHKIIFHELDIPANKIINAWNRYRIRTARIRNDLVIHGLAQYFYHPSRVILI